MRKVKDVALIVVIFVVIMLSAWYGGSRMQTHYDTIDHPVYSTSSIREEVPCQ